MKSKVSQFLTAPIDKTEYGDYTAIKQQLRRFLDEVSNLPEQFMATKQTQKTEKMQPETVKFLSLGGEEDVTRNMYLYEYKDQILIVDCGLGFPDETMLGVDLLLPDITYLLENCMPEEKATKKIVGMLLTHGHEDHIGGLPYILPQLPSFPLYGSPLTAALANEKLTEFNTQPVVQAVPFYSCA